MSDDRPTGVFHIHLIGGPLDGEVSMSPRPYDEMKIQGHRYAADREGKDCLIPLGGDEYKIVLRHRGVV